MGQPPTLKALKLRWLAAAKRRGLFERVAESRWRQRRLLILCYHGISLLDEHEWDARLFLPAAQFSSRLHQIKSARCSVLPLDDALRGLRAGTLPARAVSLTFDDGFYNYFAAATPALRDSGYPSTVYLTTYYCQRQLPVFDPLCSYLLWKGRGNVLDMEGILGQSLRFNLSDDRQRAAAFWRIWHFSRTAGIDATEKHALAERLAARLDIHIDAILRQRILHLMTETETADVSRSLSKVELHTHRHRTPRNREAFLDELGRNGEVIQAATGRKPVHFCYPSGDHCAAFVPWLTEAGVVSGTTGQPGLASRRSSVFTLPRVVDTTTLSSLEFEAWLTGFAALGPRRRVRRASPRAASAS